eukprot:m.150139 g.150139  ORF g.150139 m.150139 type:complete len:52 (+) comp15079_c0_seq3:1295-1450(+)
MSVYKFLDPLSIRCFCCLIASQAFDGSRAVFVAYFALQLLLIVAAEFEDEM